MIEKSIKQVINEKTFTLVGPDKVSCDIPCFRYDLNKDHLSIPGNIREDQNREVCSASYVVPVEGTNEIEGTKSCRTCLMIAEVREKRNSLN